jgi:hypothetical protein
MPSIIVVICNVVCVCAGWRSGGEDRAEAFQRAPDDEFRINSKVRRVVGKVVASFEDGEWLEKR